MDKLIHLFGLVLYFMYYKSDPITNILLIITFLCALAWILFVVAIIITILCMVINSIVSFIKRKLKNK
jgi:hypothetical protein